ncbi:MAG TPA: amidohydrolase [Euzebya sp.]|nr:amidohydrolase [Euzebya sp.]
MDADIVFNGGVVVGDHASPVRQQALAVSDGRIVAVGAEAAAMDAEGVIDLEGGALLPGFGDGHAHPLQGGGELAQAPIRDCSSVAEVVEAVRRHAETHPDAEWVLGGSYDPSLAPGGIFDARWLDQAVPDRPVVLQATDHHCAWVNSEALRRAGIDGDLRQPTPDPPAGTIARRPDGSAMGTLVEWSAMDLVLRHLPPVTENELVANLVRASAAFAAAGVTWVQEAALAPDQVAVYRRAADAGDLLVRANIALRAEPGAWPDQRTAFHVARRSVADHAMVRAGTVKFFTDGVIEAGTAALLQPYDDAPHTCGLPVWQSVELAQAAAAFDADGFQLHLHAIGDAGIRWALDAIAHAIDTNGPRDRRPVITHVQLVDPQDLPRFAALGVVANFQPLWARLDACQTQLTQPRIGAERSRLQYPMASMRRSGTRLSMGSDWPVSSLRPLENAAVAVTRRNSVGQPTEGWLPDQRLTAAEVLSAYTAGTAVQAFEEDAWGLLGVGRRADLVWVSADPHATAEAWADLAVLGTWLGGRRTHDPTR